MSVCLSVYILITTNVLTLGRGGDPAAIAGFNFNDSRAFERGIAKPVKYANLPNSGSESVVNLMRTSNVGNPGLWIFRVDENELVSK